MPDPMSGGVLREPGLFEGLPNEGLLELTKGERTTARR